MARAWSSFRLISKFEFISLSTLIHSFSFTRHLSIFEIYPQSEKPVLTLIAHLDFFSDLRYSEFLLTDILICIEDEFRFALRVVDYRKNCSKLFSPDFDLDSPFKVFFVLSKMWRLPSNYLLTFATKTAIIVFCKEGILIWDIPPLSPHPSYFSSHTLERIAPLFKISFPDGIVRHTPILRFITVSSWYFGSLDSLYFDILYADSKLQRFKIIVKPDLSDTSIQVINSSIIISKALKKAFERLTTCDTYSICEDALVYFCNYPRKGQWLTYAGLTSAPFTNVVTQSKGCINSLCPTSGRFAYRDVTGYGRERVAVVDIF